MTMVNTDNIIPTKPKQNFGMDKALKKLFAGLLLLACLCLTALAGPRLFAAFNNLSIDLGLGKIYANGDLAEEELGELAATARESISIYDHPHSWENLGMLFLFKADKEGLAKTNRNEDLSQAQHSFNESLLHSPANTYAWFRLAVVDDLLNAPSKQTANALAMSITTGPNEAEILLERLDLCLKHIDSFQEEGKEMVRSQIKTAWSRFKSDFLHQVAHSPKQISVIMQLMAANEMATLKEMESAFEKTH